MERCGLDQTSERGLGVDPIHSSNCQNAEIGRIALVGIDMYEKFATEPDACTLRAQWDENREVGATMNFMLLSATFLS